MDMTERLNILTGHCREAGYPETLVTAISSYLTGDGSLNALQQEWQTTQPKGAERPPVLAP